MLYHDTEGRSLLAREHAELLASEMRRVRRLSPGRAGEGSSTRLAAQLLGRTQRMRRRAFKLASIGFLVAAIAAPASAAGQGVRARHARAQLACPQTVVIQRGRNYGMCGQKFWVRDPQTGHVKAIPFWRLQRLSDPSEDRP